MTPEQRLFYLKHGWKDEVALIESWRSQAERKHSWAYAEGLQQAALDLEALLVAKLVARNRYES